MLLKSRELHQYKTGVRGEGGPSLAQEAFVFCLKHLCLQLVLCFFFATLTYWCVYNWFFYFQLLVMWTLESPKGRNSSIKPLFKVNFSAPGKYTPT